MKKHYELGRRYHKGKFIGYAIWWTHQGCTRKCCPKRIAEFYGPDAKRTALKVFELIGGER